MKYCYECKKNDKRFDFNLNYKCCDENCESFIPIYKEKKLYPIFYKKVKFRGKFV